jgi:hypothetical protein
MREASQRATKECDHNGVANQGERKCCCKTKQQSEADSKSHQECGPNGNTNQGESKRCSKFKHQSKADSNARRIAESDQRVATTAIPTTARASSAPRPSALDSNAQSVEESHQSVWPQLRHRPRQECTLAHVQAKAQSGLECLKHRREPPKSAATTAIPTEARASAAARQSTNPQNARSITETDQRVWPQPRHRPRQELALMQDQATIQGGLECTKRCREPPKSMATTATPTMSGASAAIQFGLKCQSVSGSNQANCNAKDPGMIEC